MGTKISAIPLTATLADLSDTSLSELSVPDGSNFLTKKLPGAVLKQFVLASLMGASVTVANLTVTGNLVTDILIARTAQDFRLTNMGGTTLASWSQSTGRQTNFGDGFFAGVQIGRGPGFNNSNIVLGPNALQNIVPNTGAQTGVNMLAIGSNALLNATSGFNSIAAGNSALQSMTSGNHSYAYGHVALVLMTTGNHDLAFGSVCLQNLTTGVENHSYGIHGFDALIDGNYNTGIGMGHGYLLAHGDNNVMVGRQCGELSTSASNLLLLGWNAQATTPTTSNEIVLGNASNTSFRIPGLGFSIAGSSPTATATMAGHLSVTGNLSTDVLKSFSANILFANAGGTTLGTWSGTTGLMAFGFGVSVAGALDVTGALSVGTKAFSFGAANSGGAGFRTVVIAN